MSDLVDASEIEQRVGVQRHPTRHYARADSASQTVYLLHSAECKTSGIDLRDCELSVAMDRGIPLDRWTEDEPLHVHVAGGLLVPTEALSGSQEDER